MAVDDVVHHRCTFILEKKKRPCRLLAKKGNMFCGEHSVHDSRNQTRVLCPNDPKHSVNIAELEDHLKHRCNSRLSSEEYLSEGINSSNKTGSTNEDFVKPTFDDLSSCCEIIESIYRAASQELQTYNISTPQIEEHLTHIQSTSSNNSKKHLKQLSSIIGYLLKNDSLNSETLIAEFGSGKAQLSYWLMKISPKSNFLLIDRMGSRNKYDNKAIRDNNTLNVKRLRCSIEHLDLAKVDFIQKDVHKIIAISKHLCGNATDFAIRCILNAKNFGLNISEFVFAPCCHHRTTFNEYVGIEYLKNIGICDNTKFASLRHIASWGNCGFCSFSCPQLGSDEKNNSTLNNWTPEFKTNLGRKAKFLLEFGRINFLRNALLGIDVQIFEYVPSDITPENILIVGKF